MNEDEDKEYEVYVTVRLRKDEYDTLKNIIRRDEAASMIWRWIKAVLYVAVPLTTLYTFFQYWSAK